MPKAKEVSKKKFTLFFKRNSSYFCLFYSKTNKDGFDE